MTKHAWRIVKEKHAAAAFDGEGAWLFGGRWNSRGTRVVYTSATLSLAALEILVHLTPPVMFKFVAIRVGFDEALVEKVGPAGLPVDWTHEPPSPSSQVIGDLWVKEARSAILEVPSVIVPGESNFVFNTVHPDFKNVVVGKPQSFSFDPRLL